MARSIPHRELRNDSGEIMRRLDQGESFIVTCNGVPVGELIPLRRHRFVATAAVVAIFRNAPMSMRWLARTFCLVLDRRPARGILDMSPSSLERPVSEPR